MAAIRILPEILSNKIAAGEVVERPASVVKELVENAIDAKSDRIHVDIEQGGRSLIRVSDNGIGMSHDDALLAIERYATSKIIAEPDLYDIRTLGFRGEALPSIAAVSKFSLVTRDEKSETAAEILVEGGKVKAVNQTGAPKGTMISARQLFFNTPARRKFLKTVNTEMGHISDVIACIALGRPDIRFRLMHNNKLVKDWQSTTDGFHRVIDVVGNDLRRLMYPVAFKNPAVSVSGWIGDPAATRSGTSRIYVFVNGRFIKDRSVIYALAEGYRGRLMKGRFPIAVLYLDVPPAEVDVNVHPTKHEVRFLQQRQVIDAIRKAVEGAWMAQKSRAGSTPRESSGQRQVDLFADTGQTTAPAQPPSFEKPMNREDAIAEPASLYGREATRPETKPQAGVPEQKPSPPEQPEARETPKQSRPPAPEPKGLFESAFFSDATVIGQYKNTYILCEKADELLLVDQHAAHERILYERFKGIREASGTGQVQRLLMPETVEVKYREAPIIEQLLPELNALGFEIEHFGGETFVVKAVPEVLADREIGPLIVDIAETADRIGAAPDLSGIVDQCLILMACHGAIRAHQALTPKEMTALLQQLDGCGNPFNCPHGRPTAIRWSLPFLEKQFKRTV